MAARPRTTFVIVTIVWSPTLKQWVVTGTLDLAGASRPAQHVAYADTTLAMTPEIFEALVEEVANELQGQLPY